MIANKLSHNAAQENDLPVVVIGSGLGGLAAACTLAGRGYEVIVLERSEWLGGKAAVCGDKGFRFDMGPTILTIPSVLARVLSECGKDIRRELDLIPLDPQWRCFFTDGGVLDLVANAAEMRNKLNAFCPGGNASEGYERFLNWSRRLHEISERFFFWKAVGSIRDTMKVAGLANSSVLADLWSMRMWDTVGGSIRSFVPEKRVAQMLDHFTQYVGSAPDNSPAVLCGIAHMQTSEGVWYPRGGTRAVAEALIRAASEAGAQFRANTGVTRIVTQQGKVTGVLTNSGELIRARAVVSNSDTVRTHDELLDAPVRKAFSRRRKYEPACSGVVLYLGLTKRYEQLLHHNFVFSKDPHAEFDAIYGRGVPAPDPTCYVCAPAITEPETAPPGGEALYVLVHTPYLRDAHNWTRDLPNYRRVILNKLASTAGMEDIESRIAYEHVLTPEDIDRRYHVLKGAIYGLASHGRLTGAFKPSNRSPDVAGLYFAGGSAHPGPGMPMVMMSGWIAGDTLDADLRGLESPRRGAVTAP